MAGTTDRSRAGALLIVVAGLLAVLVALATAFFVRVRNEAASSQMVEQTAQARLMLNAALQYLQEASRIGWGDPADPAQHYGLARIGAPDPAIDAGAPATGANRYWSYPDGFANPSLVPAAGDFWQPPTSPAGTDGDYAATGGAPFTPTERSWVGWYSPVHRGLFKDFWANHEWEDPADARKPGNSPDTLAQVVARFGPLAASMRNGSTGYEARIRSKPIPPTGANGFWDLFAPTHAAPADWRDGASAPWKTDASFRIRAELVDAWPVGGPPKLFPMYVRHEPPYAVWPRAALVSTFHLRKSGQPGFNTNEPWRYPRNGTPGNWPRTEADELLPDFVQTFGVHHRVNPATGVPEQVTTWYPAMPDPAIVHPAHAARWRGVGRVLDGQGRETATWQAEPLRDSVNLGWFRIYRETPDTFVITVGAGASQGWSLKPDGSIERGGVDVISRAACPFASADELRLILASEVRMWFRVTWHPGVGVKRSITTNQGCAQGGTFTMIQRLRERELGPPSLKPLAALQEKARLRALPENRATPEAVCPTW